jgi:hypothetical protein
LSGKLSSWADVKVSKPEGKSRKLFGGGTSSHHWYLKLFCELLCWTDGNTPIGFLPMGNVDSVTADAKSNQKIVVNVRSASSELYQFDLSFATADEARQGLSALTSETNDAKCSEKILQDISAGVAKRAGTFAYTVGGKFWKKNTVVNVYKRRVMVLQQTGRHSISTPPVKNKVAKTAFMIRRVVNPIADFGVPEHDGQSASSLSLSCLLANHTTATMQRRQQSSVLLVDAPSRRPAFASWNKETLFELCGLLRLDLAKKVGRRYGVFGGSDAVRWLILNGYTVDEAEAEDLCDVMMQQTFFTCAANSALERFEVAQQYHLEPTLFPQAVPAN